MRRLETFTFTHQLGVGGQTTMTSCVAPAPADPTAAREAACALVEGQAPTHVERGLLDYPQIPPGPVEQGIETVIRRYANCGRCHLSSRRFKITSTRGNVHSAVMALGGASAQDDDAFGTPFCGKEGRLIDSLLQMCGIDPSRDMAWMNSVGCRSIPNSWGDDREPLDSELLACSERALMLLRVIRPRVVICMGTASTKMFWDEPPPMWSWQTVGNPNNPQDQIIVGHARDPKYLSRVIGGRQGYREFAAARTFYGILKKQLATVTKVGEWWHVPRLTQTIHSPVAGT